MTFYKLPREHIDKWMNNISLISRKSFFWMLYQIQNKIYDITIRTRDWMSFSKPLIIKTIFLFQISLLPSPSYTFYFLLFIFSYFHNVPGFPHWVLSDIHIPFVFNNTAEDPALTKFHIPIRWKHKSPFNSISCKIYPILVLDRQTDRWEYWTNISKFLLNYVVKEYKLNPSVIIHCSIYFKGYHCCFYVPRPSL